MSNSKQSIADTKLTAEQAEERSLMDAEAAALKKKLDSEKEAIRKEKEKLRKSLIKLPFDRLDNILDHLQKGVNSINAANGTQVILSIGSILKELGGIVTDGIAGIYNSAKTVYNSDKTITTKEKDAKAAKGNYEAKIDEIGEFKDKIRNTNFSEKNTPPSTHTAKVTGTNLGRQL